MHIVFSKGAEGCGVLIFGVYCLPVGDAPQLIQVVLKRSSGQRKATLAPQTFERSRHFRFRRLQQQQVAQTTTERRERSESVDC